MDIPTLQKKAGAAGQWRLVLFAAAAWPVAAAHATPDRALDPAGGAGHSWVEVSPHMGESGAVHEQAHDRAGPDGKAAARPGEPDVSRRRAGRRSDLDEKVAMHTDSSPVRDLIDFLAPPGWRVQFDVAAPRLDRKLVFHAETTRRRALDQLCSGLGLKGIFYPGKRLVLIVEGRPQ